MERHRYLTGEGAVDSLLLGQTWKPSDSRPISPVPIDSHQPFRPGWQLWRSTDTRPIDYSTVEVPASDILIRTKVGLATQSSGVIRYSTIQGIKFRTDAERVLHLLRQGLPNDQLMWPLRKLEKAFHSAVREEGSWRKYKLPFSAFLKLFPRTFEVVGATAAHRFVRLLHPSSQTLLDDIEEVMKRLALARHSGCWSATPSDGASRPSSAARELRATSAKAVFLPSSVSSSNPSTRPTSAARSSRPTSASACRPFSRPMSARPSRPTSAQMYCRVATC